MQLLIGIFAVLFGLALGSFLNVCISRLPIHELITRPASRCPACRQPIRVRDNIPILSWILLRGCCRNCGIRIPLRYPLIEAATAALFLLCFLEFGLTVRGVASAVLCWLLLGLAATDAETLLLPDALTLPGIVLGAIYSGLTASPIFSSRAAGNALLWAAAAAACILLIRGTYWLVRRREGMGLGDAKLLAMIAAWLGPLPTLLVLLMGVFAAAIYGLILLVLHRDGKSWKSSGHIRIPLGAFLSAAAIFAIFGGHNTIYWYMSFLR